MFKSQPMTRIRVYCEKESISKLVDSLYEFGAIHITPVKHAYLPQLGQTLDYFKDVSTTLIALRTAEKILNIKERPLALQDSLSGLLKRSEKINANHVIALNEGKEKLQEELKELQKNLEEAAPFALFNLRRNYDSTKSIGSTLFQTQTNLEALKAEFSGIQNTAVYTREKANSTYVLIAFDKNQSESVLKIVAKHSLKTFTTPKIASEYYSQEVESIENQIQNITANITKISQELSSIKQEQGNAIVSLITSLEVESKKAQLPLQFGATKNLVAVEAWIPKKHEDTIENKLNAASSITSYVEFVKTRELAPTQLQNPKGIKSFEELVKFFSLPKSTELDPTMLVAVSFPLFFGMIVGDIGYGLVSLIGAIALKSKIDKRDKFVQSIGTMLAVSSIASIIFGVIFGEFFGFEHIFGYALNPLIHRSEEHGLALLMALSILFGMIHLAIGYLIGAWQSFAHHHAKHGYAKLSWLVLEFSLALFVAGNIEIPFLHFIQPFAAIITPNISLPIMLASIIGIAVFEGATALVEIPSLISNIFSYLRIMALGVSGVIIALILNKITESLTFTTPIGIITSILLLVLFVVGHAMSIALALFESMIQSMRLQYVEFFSKFFQGGGIAFSPLNPNKE